MRLESKMLVLAPHCDDVDFIASGLITISTLYGATVDVAILTDSNNGNGHGKERLDEQMKSAEILGVRNVFPIGPRLSIPDGKLSLPHFSLCAFEGSKHILDAADARGDPYKRLMTFEPGGMTGHLDHAASSKFAQPLYTLFPDIEEVLLASFSPDQRREFLNSHDGSYTFEVPEVQHHSLTPFPVSGVIYDRRVAALLTHESQIEDMKKRVDTLPQTEYYIVNP